jgi:CTP synthase
MNTPHVQPKYIFVMGGVLSGVGKGISAASIGAVLKARGLKVSVQKCEAYLNVDAGTLNPAEHGECFVTKDGTEIDLDLGHYERFLDIELTKDSVTLAGRVYRDLIQAERDGKFLGKTVQMIPHFTDAVQLELEKSSTGSDVHIVELGGTVGDIESLGFVEAFREFSSRIGRENCMFIHVIYIPYLQTSKELKTKPAQNALRELRSFGIMPDIIGARADYPISKSAIEKISLFGGVPESAVVPLPNAQTIYEVPLTLEKHGIASLIERKFGFKEKSADMSAWQALVDKAIHKSDKNVHIGIVAKYLDNEDTYYSVLESLKAAAWNEGVTLEYSWVDAEKITQNLDDLDRYDGLLVPGGFGTRGVEGKISAAGWALENNKPYLGICLGLQAAVIAAARRAGVKNATSAELDQAAKDQVIYLMSDQAGKEATGGTMRLGNYIAELTKGSKVFGLYGEAKITERHRHRYEVNRDYEKKINNGGLVISGESPDGKLVEFVEAKDHPYFVATQAHPEFKSRPNRPHPLFSGLIKAAKK